MIYDADEYARLRNAVLGVSLIAWIVILVEPRASPCCAVGGSWFSLKLLLAANPPLLLARDWVLMLIAMMSPMLVPALYHIRISSFVSRRLRSTALFALSYGALWMAAGTVLLAMKLAATWLAPRSYFPAIVVGFVVVAWQASPFKQRCLNRCHYHRPLAAFGTAADWDVVRFGLEQGVWCASSCWAAMLFPLLLPDGHLLAMAAVSILMFCERLDPPRTPSWGWRGFGTAFSYLMRRLRGPRSGPAPWTPLVQS
jgi:predicted metal-binding membrane protein